MSEESANALVRDMNLQTIFPSRENTTPHEALARAVIMRAWKDAFRVESDAETNTQEARLWLLSDDKEEGAFLWWLGRIGGELEDVNVEYIRKCIACVVENESEGERSWMKEMTFQGGVVGQVVKKLSAMCTGCLHGLRKKPTIAGPE